MSDSSKLLASAMRVVPRKRLSRTVRRLVQVRSKMAVRKFAARFDLNMDEAEHPLEHYESILELFTRRLKPGARTIDPLVEAFVSPVDGAFLVGGDVGDGTLVQAKGRTYSLQALLGDPDAASVFADGTYLTIYLAPKDYHRIHSPADGGITGYTHIPGDLFPVNASGVEHVDQLFARNERVISHLQTETFGRVEVVKVGATNVGHIKLAYEPSMATNVGTDAVRRGHYDPPLPIQRGEELGVFEMGSTVILVTERPVDLKAFSRGDSIVLGSRLGLAR